MINQFTTKEARMHNGVKTGSSISVLGKLDRYMQKSEIRPLLTLYIKMNSNELKTSM